MKITKWISALLILSSLSVQAQNCDYCNAALAKQTTDDFETIKKSSYQSALNTLFSHDYDFWSNYSGYTSKTSEMDAGFGLFDIIDFDGGSSSTYTKSELKQKFEKIRTYYSTNKSISSDDYTWISQKTASKTVYDAWVTCLKDCPYNQKGVAVNFVGDDQEYFIMTLSWIPADGTGTQIKVQNIVPVNAELMDDGELRDGSVLRPFSSLSRKFRRIDINKDLSIVINTDNAGPKTVKIPKYVSPEQPKTLEVPVGTIIASIFDYQTFTVLNNQTPIFDIIKSKWAPADGRSVVGSEFGRILTNVPDLRGVFLRGLNQFYKNGEGAPTLSGAQADPENSRTSGKFQSDTFTKHKHTVGPLNVGHSNIGNGEKLNPNWRITSDDGPNWQNVNIQQTTNEVGDAETRPKNVAIYYYIRVNK